jgi:hypothetical protein
LFGQVEVCAIAVVAKQFTAAKLNIFNNIS